MLGWERGINHSTDNKFFVFLVLFSVSFHVNPILHFFGLLFSFLSCLETYTNLSLFSLYFFSALVWFFYFLFITVCWVLIHLFLLPFFSLKHPFLNRDEKSRCFLVPVLTSLMFCLWCFFSLPWTFLFFPVLRLTDPSCLLFAFYSMSFFLWFFFHMLLIW